MILYTQKQLIIFKNYEKKDRLLVKNNHKENKKLQSKKLMWLKILMKTVIKLINSNIIHKKH